MKNYLSYIILCLAFYFPLQVFAEGNDTLLIPEVRLVATRTGYFSEDLQQVTIDTFLLSHRFSQNLGEILTLVTPVGINAYGATGSLNTISLRGTASSHTSVLWNGLPINSISTGIADLSITPAVSFNRITLTYGTSGSLAGSGTFGGTLELTRNPDWGNHHSVKIRSEVGSFRHFAGGIDLAAGTETFRFNLNAFYQNSQNNFPFTDTEKIGSPVEKQEHNGLQNTGFLQNLYWKLPKGNTLETGTWYQIKRKQLPVLMGDYGNSLREQTDSTLKVYLKWKKTGRNWSLSATSAYLYDYLRFLDAKLDPDGHYAIDSKITTNQGYFDLNGRSYLTPYFTIDFGVNMALLSAEVRAYRNRVNEFRANFFSGFKYVRGPWVWNASLRLHSNPYQKMIPLPSLGARFSFPKNRSWMKVNISSKYRLPGFNDKYWQPGGNPNLLPERGWGGSIEFGWNVMADPEGNPTLTFESSLFSNNINQWIQWIPGNGFWYPVNFKKVWSRGIENTGQLLLIKDMFTLKLRAGYSYTIATVSDAMDRELIGNQLQYVPRHLLTASADFFFGPCYMLFNYRFTGKRFTSNYNLEVYSLKSWQTVELTTGYQFRKKLTGSFVQFRVSNLFNEQYQPVKLYAMPGRSYAFSLEIVFNGK